MKKLVLLSAIILGLTAGHAQSQALVLKDFNWNLQTDDGIYPATETMAVFTPSGNILHKQEFYIDLDDALVPEKGVRKVTFRTRVSYMGTIYEMVHIKGNVFSDGRVDIVFHLNGSGAVSPGKQ